MIGRGKSAAPGRFYSQQSKVVRGTDRQTDSGRARGASEVIIVVPGRRDVIEYPGMLKVFQLRLRHPNIACTHTRQVILNSHQLLWVRVRQWMQQSGIDHAKDGRG